jgi:hypothetical protein
VATIDNLVSVTITEQAAAVTVPSFSVPLILGSSAAGWQYTSGDVIHTYNEPSQMLTDGFTVSSPEYLAAQAMYAQTTTPDTFKVGHRSGGSVEGDLEAIQLKDNTWYGLVLAGCPESDIIPTATAIESLKKFYLASASDIAITQSTSTTDIGAELQASGFNRTGLVYTTQNTNGTLESAWMGSQLPATPGSNNWAYKTLAGVKADNVSANQANVLIGEPIAGTPGKNVNLYQSVGGVDITQMGTAASGRFFDITIGLDWLEANLQTQIFGLLAAAPKVPYTDAGASMLLNVVNSVLRQGAANGLIDDKDADNPIYVRCDKVSTVPSSMRANRIAPTIYFGGRLQGAFNSVALSGTVVL